MHFPTLASLSVFVGALAAILLAGILCVLYGILIERRWYRARRYRVAVLAPGSGTPLTVLHLSDLHMVARDDAKVRFLASLPAPDVAVVTGDFLGEPDAVERVLEALRPLRGRLASYFVLGSNDLYAPKPLNYASYFMETRPKRKAVPGRDADLRQGLIDDGWIDLDNRRTELAVNGSRLEVMGMHDPHIQLADLRLAPRKDAGAVGLAVVHSPDPAPELAAFGWDLILTGHTHGGQVRMPLVGALVTNSHIPTRLCRGLSLLPPAVMHVSPGLGTSKYAPFRFLCRPEATILELLPRQASATH
jgi:predicted MPP superfamily phosphohydrolase